MGLVQRMDDVWSVPTVAGGTAGVRPGSGRPGEMKIQPGWVTWGMVALAISLSVGMVEWGKRSAAGEVTLEEKDLQQATASAAGRKGIRGLGVSHGGNWERESGDFVKVNENESGVRKAESGNEAATIQTRAGVER